MGWGWMVRNEKQHADLMPPIRLQASWPQRIRRDFHRNKWVYLIALVCLSWYFIFCYAPMGGIVIR